jgi:hypothetical protein
LFRQQIAQNPLIFLLRRFRHDYAPPSR